MAEVVEQASSQGWSGYQVIGPTLPLKPKEIWAVRIRLQMASRVRDLGLFNLGVDIEDAISPSEDIEI